MAVASQEWLDAEDRMSRIFVRVGKENVSVKDMSLQEFANWFGNRIVGMAKREINCEHEDEDEICTKSRMVELLEEGFGIQVVEVKK